jgi:hypothetical protein
LRNASHVIEDINYDKGTKKVTGRIRLLNTDAGKQAMALVDAGVPLHISSRAAGVVEGNGHVKIKKMFTYDLVADPGFANAELKRVNESFGFEDAGDILIYEIPLLVETGASEKFDYVITVESDIELRKARLLKKGLYISQIEKRMASQASEEARTAVADAVIRNDGDEDSLLRQVENLWESVLLPQSLG